MIAEMLKKKPGNEAQVLTERAKDGLLALDTIVAERNAAMAEVQAQRQVIDRLTMENESLRQAVADAVNQRDFWMRVHAKLESNLNQLGKIMENMWTEFHGRQPMPQPIQPQPPGDVRQIAQRLAPEKQANVK